MMKDNLNTLNVFSDTEEEMIMSTKNTNTTQPEELKVPQTPYIDNEETTRKIGHIRVNEERTALVVFKIQTTWLCRYAVDADTGKIKNMIGRVKKSSIETPVELPMHEISLDQLKGIRAIESKGKLNTALFLFKEYGHYYVAKIPKRLNFYETDIYDDIHMCRYDCCHLYAMPVEQGGCQKVIDRWKRLEAYDFIDVGYQTFGPLADKVFDVCKCSYYKKSPPRGKKKTEPTKEETEKENSMPTEHYFNFK